MNFERVSDKYHSNEVCARAGLLANNFQLEHHFIPDTIPNLPSIVSQSVCPEIKLEEEDHKLFPLHTDITIKEEPVDVKSPVFPAESFCQDILREDLHNHRHTLPGKHFQRLQVSKEKSRNSRKRLRCPECPTSFVHGPYGAGLELLVGHVYMKHKRLQVSCLLNIRRMYTSIVKDAVSKGYLPLCSGLVHHADWMTSQ